MISANNDIHPSLPFITLSVLFYTSPARNILRYAKFLLLLIYYQYELSTVCDILWVTCINCIVICELFMFITVNKLWLSLTITILWRSIFKLFCFGMFIVFICWFHRRNTRHCIIFCCFDTSTGRNWRVLTAEWLNWRAAHWA